MSTSPLLLESRMEPDQRDATIATLRDQLHRLDEALRLERNRIASVEYGVRELRHILSPLYKALQKVFDELDSMDTADGSATSTGNSRWDAIKARNPGRIAQAIDVLLLHGSMNSSQLAAAMRMNRSNCSNNVVVKMKAMGLIVKNGNDISLRQL